jgi:hypothetical protein
MDVVQALAALVITLSTYGAATVVYAVWVFRRR